MADTINLTAIDGTPVSYVDTIIGQGAMKDVYFSPNRDYVVAFFRGSDKLSLGDRHGLRDRLATIVGRYRTSIFTQIGGDYWKDQYCWPERVVEHNGLLGLVVPAYAQQFIFKKGAADNSPIQIKGAPKEGKWFATSWHKYGILDSSEQGDWLSYLRICIKLARAVKRLHVAGLAHSDLSYKNVLIDPVTASVNIIDIDGLVVPGKYPPDVVGTPDFIAPEVIQTLKLKKDDKNRFLPSQKTDLHALAVLIYMYLLNRHPLQGKKVHDIEDEARDEELVMGEKALFIEHSTDRSNRYDMAWVKRDTPSSRFPHVVPWKDLDNLPYTVLGPYVAEVVRRALEDGLHDPASRPAANDWETALVKTTDLLQPCKNVMCPQKWFVFDNTKKPVCPFCKTPFSGLLPVLNLYSKYGASYKDEKRRVMVYNGVRLYPWHVNRNVFPNERLSPDQMKPVAYFQFHGGQWFLVNQTLAGMKDIRSGKKVIAPNEHLALSDGLQILLSEEEGGRLAQVQLVQC